MREHWEQALSLIAIHGEACGATGALIDGFRAVPAGSTDAMLRWEAIAARVSDILDPRQARH